MKILKAVLVFACAGAALILLFNVFSEEAPEVVQEPPKTTEEAPFVTDGSLREIWRQREEQILADREAAAAEAAAAATEAARLADALKFAEAQRTPFGIEMVTINPGEGQLGSPVSEVRRSRHENPMRTTNITYRFEVSKYEITFDQWDRCVSDGGCKGHNPKDNGWGRGNHPVINISFNDAQNFLSWLRKATGKKYRLLSEAEWEYVARGGQKSAPFGQGFDMSAQLANFDGKAPYGAGTRGTYLRRTQPVGSYAPNAFGVYDMHGNVYEWVEDCWSPDHSKSPADGSARKDGDCKFRVMKGGSWVTHGYQTRTAYRRRYITNYRYEDYGLRIARTLN